MSQAYGKQFASIYSDGFSLYAERAAPLMLGLAQRWGHQPHRILDLACGEGTAALTFARQGYEVIGVDGSPWMLALARQKAVAQGAEISFLEQDMRELHVKTPVDLATCMYDALNYLLTERDLGTAFAGVAASLVPGGLFIFDMNTMYGLATVWGTKDWVRVNSDDHLEVHQCVYDWDRATNTLTISGFTRQGEQWQRYSETHTERGYPLETVRGLLEAAGLAVLEVSALERWELKTPGPQSVRLFFVAKKS